MERGTGRAAGLMGKVLFYHLTRRALPEALAPLLDKSLERGWRVLVRGTDPDRLDRLDAALWLGPEERFLPHGRAGGSHDADQPVLLTTGTEAPNGAVCLVAVDGAPVSPADANVMERVCILFDGRDEAAVAGARAQWTALTGSGIGAQYWSEEAGRWEMKAER